MKLPRFSLRELFLLVVISAIGCGWWVERSRLLATNTELQGEVQRLKKGPEWGAMDRIMDRYALHWDLVRKRERELGLPETPDPFEVYDDDPQPGDPVPHVPASIWPDDIYE